MIVKAVNCNFLKLTPYSIERIKIFLSIFFKKSLNIYLKIVQVFSSSIIDELAHGRGSDLTIISRCK